MTQASLLLTLLTLNYLSKGASLLLEVLYSKSRIDTSIYLFDTHTTHIELIKD